MSEDDLRELHHFEAEKALTDLLALSWAITHDSHCSHLGADIRALIPADILATYQPSERGHTGECIVRRGESFSHITCGCPCHGGQS